MGGALPNWILARRADVDSLTPNQKRSLDYHCARYEATPPWLGPNERAQVNAIYREAALRRQNGERVVVDHCVPLKGETVCGLHVPWNLQIITEDENQRKAARQWHGQWEHHDLFGVPELRISNQLSQPRRFVRIWPTCKNHLPGRRVVLKGNEYGLVMVAGVSKDRRTLYYYDYGRMPKVYAIRAEYITRWEDAGRRG